MNKEILPPIHPGELLKEDFMEPLGLSANKLAQHLGVPANSVTDIVNGKRAISADTAFRLAKCFGTSVEMWLNLQLRYELDRARYEGVPEKVAKEVRTLAS
jgi:antitoxin HigA-1